jgi:CDP-ribitol ribitolphosphotransferase / teichoic acid ribitol-phosphate polymerase
MKTDTIAGDRIGCGTVSQSTKTECMQLLLRAGIAVAAGIYALFKLMPVQHRVLFVSRQADRPSRDFRYLAEELQRRDASLDVRMLCKTLPGDLLGRTRYLGEVIRQMFHLATSKVCIVDGYVIPVSTLKHRPELYVVQPWHALGAIKKFGYQSIGHEGGRPRQLVDTMRMHRNYDVVLCGSAAMVPVFAEAFGVDEARVKPIGLPRVDILRERATRADKREPKRIADLRHRNPRLDDTSKTVLLCAPTYRHTRSSVLQELAEAADPEKYTLLLKPHDLEPHAVAGPHVVDATGINVFDLMAICDAVVTDYSAIAFEACILHKPLYFYVPDIAEYAADHGLNVNPLEFVPYASAVDAKELLELVDRGEGGVKAAEAFRGHYPPMPGSRTEQIADLIDEHLETNGI